MSEKFPIPLYQNGVVREAAVDEVLAPPDSVELAINVHFDRIGALTLRGGLTLLGSQITAGTAILGMGAYRNNASTLYQPLAMIGTTVKAYITGAWTNVRTGLTNGSRARFTNFVDYTFMVNGRGNEVCATYAGSGSFGSTNVASLPKGDYIENYRSRIWIADALTDKLYYSDVVNTDNTITGGSSFIQISPADGMKIRGLKRTSRALLVFKEDAIYRVFSINSTDPDPSINCGTYSQESIVDGKDGIYYHHSTGFYRFVFDGEQEEVSRPIIDIVKAIPRSSYENITGWAENDAVCWSIGDITVSGMTLQNLVCKRTISTKIWTIYSYPNEFRSATVFDDGYNLYQLLGDTDGNVLKYDTGVTDNATPIYYDVITHWTYLTQSKFLLKSLTKMVAFHENAKGMKLQYQLDTDNQKNTNNAWRDMGEIKTDVFQNLSLNATNFTRIRFRLSGNSTGTPFIFRGFEGVDITTTQPQ